MLGKNSGKVNWLNLKFGMGAIFFPVFGLVFIVIAYFERNWKIGIFGVFLLLMSIFAKKWFKEYSK